MIFFLSYPSSGDLSIWEDLRVNLEVEVEKITPLERSGRSRCGIRVATVRQTRSGFQIAYTWPSGPDETVNEVLAHGDVKEITTRINREGAA